MANVVRITADGKIERFEYQSGDYERVHSFLCALIGAKCDTLEMVKPIRLYSEWKCPELGRSQDGVVMVVDEEGLYHDLELNKVGSYLYMTDVHGSPIVGDVLLMGVTSIDDGGDWCGISDDIAEYVEARARELLRK